MDNEKWLSDRKFIQTNVDAWQLVGQDLVVIFRRFVRRDGSMAWRCSLEGWLGYGEDAPSAFEDAKSVVRVAAERMCAGLDKASKLMEPA